MSGSANSGCCSLSLAAPPSLRAQGRPGRTGVGERLDLYSSESRGTRAGRGGRARKSRALQRPEERGSGAAGVDGAGRELPALQFQVCTAQAARVRSTFNRVYRGPSLRVLTRLQNTGGPGALYLCTRVPASLLITRGRAAFPGLFNMHFSWRRGAGEKEATLITFSGRPGGD